MRAALHPNTPKLVCTHPRSFPALRSIVVCFLEAVPLLMSVVGMLTFFLFIFGVTGTELFAGEFHKVGRGRLGGHAGWAGSLPCSACRSDCTVTSAVS